MILYDAVLLTDEQRKTSMGKGWGLMVLETDTKKLERDKEPRYFLSYQEAKDYANAHNQTLGFDPRAGAEAFGAAWFRLSTPTKTAKK